MLSIQKLCSRYLTKPRPALAGYAGASFFARYRTVIYLLIMAAMVAMGVTIGLTGQNYFMGFAGVTALLMLFVIWALPEIFDPPFKAISFFFFSYMVALMVWPDYLALSIPGLPWITAVRITSIPLAVFFFVSLSVSPTMRQTLKDILMETKYTTWLIVIFIVLSLISVVFSAYKAMSFDKFVTSLLSWHLIFFASCWLFRDRRRVMLFMYMMWGFAVVASFIGLQESRVGGVLWAGHIPSFLAIEDELVQRILSGSFRAAIGEHRIQGKFTTPLALAEFLAYAMPFALYFVVYGRNWFLKIAGVLTLPLFLQIIFLTDSRLGFVGFCIAILFFALFGAARRWDRVKDSVVGPALTLAFPAILMVFIASTFLVGRIRARVWGTGAHSFSTEARETQVADGLPMIFSHPWGYGMGMGAETLGYRDLSGMLSIDSYFLSIGLEYGIIGFIVFYGIFACQITYAGIGLKKYQDDYALVLIPATITLISYIVIKSVFSQQDNHPLIFAILGMISAVLYQLKIRTEAQTG